jgi:uncharacterized repeat protein (TIGR03803 family)
MILFFAASSVLASEQILYQFPGPNRGEDPQYGIVFDSQGNAYGTTENGGTYGWGTIFRLEPSQSGWTERVLYSFRGSSDGFFPSGNLVIDAVGNLYGTTQDGGTGPCSPDYIEDYCGTVFELTQSNGKWEHAVLYNFCSLSGCSDGAGPQGLTFDTAGNLYGTTSEGGAEYYGTVYKLSLSQGVWKQTVLHAFDNNGDGITPAPGVTIDKSGNLYGATYGGGGYGWGLIFELKHGKKGWREVMIYAFDGSGNYFGVNGSLALDFAGNIFGTTRGDYENCQNGCGMVYRLSHVKGQWVLSPVYIFDGPHGAGPNAGFVRDRAGNFYGSTFAGGDNNFGEVFKLKPGKTWTIGLLYSFTGAGSDERPNFGLIFGPGGGLYGTTPGFYSDQFYGEVFEVLP